MGRSNATAYQMKFVAQINEEIFYLTSVVRLLLRELSGLKREGGTVPRQTAQRPVKRPTRGPRYRSS